MIETKIIAYNERYDILVFYGIPFEIYWSGGIAFFSFYNEDDLAMAYNILGF